MAGSGPGRLRAGLAIEARVVEGRVGQVGGCPACRGELDLEQPVASDPDRFVAVCRKCGTWYLMDIGPSDHEFVMVKLPGRDEVLRAAQPATRAPRRAAKVADPAPRATSPGGGRRPRPAAGP